MNEQKHPTQIAVLIDNVISERRLALSCQNVKINQNYESETYGFFCIVEPSMAKRILTNIYNNSYEAIVDNGGVIHVSLGEDNGFCVISIADNGQGISSHDAKSIFKRGFSTKINGSGLGLYHAKEKLIEWGANIEIFSSEGQGTEVRIKIPLVPPPLWFVSKLSLLENEVVVCVDDSVSVYQSWQERLKLFGKKTKLIYCSSKESFVNELKHLKYESATYLIDFEFTGKSYNGFDIANLLLTIGNPKNRIYMVTSRSGENNIQNYCVRNSIRIIPKNFAVKIPLRVFNVDKCTIVLVAFGNKEISSLDDSKCHIYSNANDFVSDMPYFNEDIKIYIQNTARNEHIDQELMRNNLTARTFHKLSDLENPQDDQ